jgi:hypothetical protein
MIVQSAFFDIVISECDFIGLEAEWAGFSAIILSSWVDLTIIDSSFSNNTFMGKATIHPLTLFLISHHHFTENQFPHRV